MKTRILNLILFLGFSSGLIGQAVPSFEDQLNAYWKQKNYPEIKNLLDEKASANPPDVAALSCAKFFYIFVQPNKEKALAAAAKLLTAARATKNSAFTSFAKEELEEIRKSPETEFAPDQEVLNLFHTQSPDEYPNIRHGVLLRRYINR